MQLIAMGSSIEIPGIGGPATIIRAAMHDLTKRLGGIRACSRLFGTLAWPDPSQPHFINAAVLTNADLSPDELLGALLDIEAQYGRQRSVPNAPRTLDLDLIAVDACLWSNEHLTLPHPRMQDRVFVLEPMCDIWPDWRHPVLHETAQELLDGVKVRPDYDPSAIWVHED